MLANIVATYHAQFEALAEAWLTSGAKTFAVWGLDTCLARWPDKNATAKANMSEQIFVGGKAVAELRVAAAPTMANHSRLKAEAALISHLMKLATSLDSVTNELIDMQDQLLAIYDLSKTTKEQVALVKEMQSLVAKSSRLVKTEASFLMLQMPGWPTLIEHHPTALVDTTILESVLKIVQATSKEILLDREESAKLSMNFGNLLLMPIRISDGIHAALGLINKKGGEFLSPDIKLARAISQHIGTRIENALLHEQNAEQVKLQSELNLAQRVHFNLLPRQLPNVTGLDLWASSRPALQFGGDFYDFFMRTNHALSFAVGDVSGKGLPAALLMEITRTVFRTKTSGESESTPKSVMVRSNEELYDAFTNVNMFATVFLGQYDVVDRKMLYANAGHSPVIYRPAGGDARLLQADTTAIGILPTNQPENQQLDFQQGDVLVVGTDGLNEAHNEQDEMFGYDRLLSIVNILANMPAKEIAHGLYHAVERFSDGHPQYDDQTLMVLKGVSI